MKNPSAYERARDQKTADTGAHVKGYTPELMCSAHGCPNRWTVDSNDKGLNRLCSAHAWAPVEDWPLITQQQQWDETDRARSNGEAKQSTSRPVTFEEKREIIRGLQPALEKLRAKAIAA